MPSPAHPSARRAERRYHRFQLILIDYKGFSSPDDDVDEYLDIHIQGRLFEGEAIDDVFIAGRYDFYYFHSVEDEPEDDKMLIYCGVFALEKTN